MNTTEQKMQESEHSSHESNEQMAEVDLEAVPEE